MKNKYFRWVIYIVLLSISINCNFKEQCKITSGYENYDGCAILIGIYNSSSVEEQNELRLDVLLGVCLLTHLELQKCEKESIRWPLPD